MSSKYLELARKAAARNGPRRTDKDRSLREGPLDRIQGIGFEPDQAHGELNVPVLKRDKSDQSSDYRAVLEVLRNPPYWLKGSYMKGYRRGTVSLPTLSAAVAAALGRSPYEWAERLTPLVGQAMQEEMGV